MSDACVALWLELSTGNRKTWARITAQSRASIFPQKDFKFFKLFIILTLWNMPTLACYWYLVDISLVCFFQVIITSELSLFIDLFQ